MGCFVWGGRNGMGCFVRGSKNGMGCFVRGDKNCMGCFVRGGKLMRDVLSLVLQNGMGCFVPGCFVLHSDHRNACSRILNFANNSEKENSQNKDHAKISESTVRGHMGPGSLTPVLVIRKGC